MKFTEMKIYLGTMKHREGFVDWSKVNKISTYILSEICYKDLMRPDYVYGVHIDPRGMLTYYTDETTYRSSNVPEWYYSVNTGLVYPVQTSSGIKNPVPVPAPVPETSTQHVHAVHLRDLADNPKGDWQYKHTVGEHGWSEWKDVTTKCPNFLVRNLYRRKPERVFPETNMSELALQSAYENNSRANGFKAIANAAIKQYILDTGAT